MTAKNRSGNSSFVNVFVLPLLFLTVVLLGGLRISGDQTFIFVAPPLVTLVLAVLLMLLFVRGRLVEINRWVASDRSPLTNISNGWMLLTLFFASAQTFNSVLPERGLLHWMFSFFFLWTLWNNQFSSFDARRLLRSLTVLFGTAFVLKHLLLASLYNPEGGWLKRITGTLLQGASLGTLDAPAFAPATGYVSFFTIALYVAGLFLLTFAADHDTDEVVHKNQLALRESVLEDRAYLHRIQESPAGIEETHSERGLAQRENAEAE